MSLTLWDTLNKWISGILLEATTNRIMIDHGTLSRQSTSTETRVDAFLVTASSVSRAICANDTLCSTEWWRSFESSNAAADSLTVGRTTMAVRTAG